MTPEAPLLFDRSTFFALVRKPLFSGKLSQEQVGGMEEMLECWETLFPKDDVRELSYIFSTTHRETGRRMVPVEEKTDKTGDAYFFRMYDIRGNRPKVAKMLGNTQPGDGVKYHGRGRVQNTGRANALKIEKLTGQPIVANPDLLLDPKVDAVCTFVGMKAGIYTGKKLSDYFSATKNDPKNARRIINGLDHADEIAANHLLFLSALTGARAAQRALTPQ